MKLKGVILTLLFLLIFLPLFLIAGILGLAATEKGSRWLIENTARWLPGELKTGPIQGTLLKRLEIQNLAYESHPHQLRIAHLILAWQPWDLTDKQLTFEALTVTGLHYQGPASTQTQSPTPVNLPEIQLPAAIKIKQLHLQDAVIQQGEETIAIQRLEVKAEAAEQTLTVQQMRLVMPPLSATLRGQVTLTQDYPLSATIDWHYRLSEPEQPPIAFHGQGSFDGTLKGLTIHHQLTDPFMITTEGSLNPLEQPIRANLKGHWQNLRWPPNRPDFQSTRGNYRIHGNLDTYSLVLTGQFNGRSLPSGRLQLKGKGSLKNFQIGNALIHTLEGQINLQGNLAWQPDIHWDLAIKGKQINPEKVAPDWPGQVDFVSHSKGSLSDKGMAVAIAIDQLKGKLRDQPVEAVGRVIYRKDQWQFQALNIKSGNNRLHLNGQLGDQLNLNFKLDGKDLSGAWPTLQGQLYAQGRLVGPINEPHIQLTARGRKLRWQNNRLRAITLKVSFSPQDPASHAHLRLRHLKLDGQIIRQLNAKAQGNFPNHTLTLDANVPQGRIHTHLQGDYLDRRWRGQIDSLSFRASNGKRMAFPEHGKFNAAVSLDFNTAPAQLAGKVEINIPDISRLAPWIPQLDQPKGRFSMETRLSGTLENPLMTGELHVANGAARIRAAGIHLQKLNLSAINRDGRRFIIAGRCQSGDGWVKIRGWLEPLSDSPAMSLSLKGKAFEVARLPQAKVLASPDLTFLFKKHHGRLQGKVTLPKAKLKIKELPPEAVAVSEDEIIIGKEKPKRSIPFTLTSQVRLELGNEVRFKGYGMKTKLTGNLNIRSRDAQTTAHGVIHLKEGKYKAFGQEIDIATGKLIFNGPVDNPYLDLSAVRKIDSEGVTVTLRVSGPLTKPVLTVTSQPPLPKTEALAYLLTGRSFEKSDSDEKTMIANAALSLGTSLARPWLKRLGLDEIKVKTGATREQTALTLGKYLTPDLYVGYAFHLFNGQGAALLRYRVSKHIALEAQSGASQSLDVFYTLETD
ncbi:MAG: hypothetical protein AXA67_06255 [Methylothermaceae bacteria B42]|nr:MAG: hypothetical protein AXA67_06255 [Methylothermaceae bacteria B42]HHJ39860.1 hypothetical protein [Methylothermaceae bacterium]